MYYNIHNSSARNFFICVIFHRPFISSLIRGTVKKLYTEKPVLNLYKTFAFQTLTSRTFSKEYLNWGRAGALENAEKCCPMLPQQHKQKCGNSCESVICVDLRTHVQLRQFTIIVLWWSQCVFCVLLAAKLNDTNEMIFTNICLFSTL